MPGAPLTTQIEGAPMHRGTGRTGVSMLWAEGGPDWGWPAFITALVGGAVAIMNAVIGAWLLFSRWQAKQQVRATKERDRLIDRLAEETESLRQEVARRQAADLACRQEVAELRGRVASDWDALRRQQGLLKSWREHLVKNGLLVEDVPEVPEPPPWKAQRAAELEADYTTRQHAHSAGLLKADVERVRKDLPAN